MEAVHGHRKTVARASPPVERDTYRFVRGRKCHGVKGMSSPPLARSSTLVRSARRRLRRITLLVGAHPVRAEVQVALDVLDDLDELLKDLRADQRRSSDLGLCHQTNPRNSVAGSDGLRESPRDPHRCRTAKSCHGPQNSRGEKVTCP